jgi:hypothetical protein
MPPRWLLQRQFAARPAQPQGDSWVLESSDDRPLDPHLEIVFSGCQPPAINGKVTILSIQEGLAEHGQKNYLIETDAASVTVRAQSLYVHETPGMQYVETLPPRAVPITQRWLWKLLLAVLRVPGAFTLITRLRRRRTQT